MMLKVLLWLGGLVVVAGVGVWLWFGGMLDPLLTEVGLVERPMMPDESGTAQTKPSTNSSELTTGRDTSDPALEQDLKNLDAQLNSYNETSATVDQSLQDEPVQQEY